MCISFLAPERLRQEDSNIEESSDHLESYRPFCTIRSPLLKGKQNLILLVFFDIYLFCGMPGQMSNVLIGD